MTTPALKRLEKERAEMESNPPEGVRGGPVGGDLTLWEAAILGPEGTPFEGREFLLDMKFGNKYPHEPPRVTFKTKVYHPNVNSGGYICIDILKNQWSPALRVSNVLLSILSLLSDPNPDDPLEHEIAKQYKSNRAKYNAMAKDWAQKYGQIPAKRKSPPAAASSSSIIIIDDDQSGGGGGKKAKTSSTDSSSAAAGGGAAATGSSGKPMCQYGASCYRKNPDHLKQFDHPAK